MEAPGSERKQVVLVVDDMPENLHVVGSLLAPDYRVLVANSGQRALEIVGGDCPPDLILLDVMMPEMDGYTVLARLRENPDSAEIPVIFLTAMNGGEDEARGITLGAADYLVKPVQPVVLRARVQNQLDLSNARNALRQHRDELELRVRERTAELDLARQAAEAANRAKTLFLGNMGHELRTPMAGVISMLELLLGSALSDEQRELAGIAHESAEVLLKVLNDILDFADVDAGHLVVENISFGPADILQDVHAMFAAKAQDKHLVFRVDVASDVPATLGGSARHLRQILIRLVDNAVKFTEPDGEVGIHAEVAGREGGALYLRVAVEDTGIGIKGGTDRLFEPFVQGDDSISRQYGGTGLGLAVAARMAHALGGRVTYAPSGHGPGSVFQLECPFSVISPE